MLELHALLRGTVQGVGFRATARRLGRQLHLTGTVQNLPDGSVELLAQGDQLKLNNLLHQLKRIFRLSLTESSITFRDVTTALVGFEILR